jgi:hypothetical protein
MLQSELILERYKRREKEADKLGRLIVVRKLRPSEQTKIAGMCADLTGADELIGPNGEKVLVPHRIPLTVAASVCEIDGVMIPFPKNRGELDAIYDRLDAEGLAAASAAIARMQGDEVVSPLDEAKN